MKKDQTNDTEPDIEAKLKKSDPEVQRFVTSLKKENLKLHQKIAKLQAENVSLDSRIQVIEKEYSGYKLDNPVSEVSGEEREELRKFAAAYLKNKHEKT